MLLFLTCILFLLDLVQSKLLTDPSLVADAYDFVVVGAGTAGSVVANRLTEDPEVRVLIIEAGVNNEGVDDLIIPFFGPRAAPNTPWTWNYTTVPQNGTFNRSILYPRGRVLGGSSSVNLLVYTRGSLDDYNRWANATLDDGWSWNALQPYIHKQERFVESADHHNTTGQFNPAIHGYAGPVEVSLPGFPFDLSGKVLETLRELPEFQFDLDMNSGDTIGIGWTQSTIGHSKRSSSATAYLEPQFLLRDNLDVLIESQALKLIHNGFTDGLPAFTAVEFAQNRTGRRFTVTAHQEIIISAGSINTPQLLMLSGIGDKDLLKPLGISTIVHLPSVGANLSDHPILASQFLVNSTETFETAERNATLAAEELALYKADGTGPLVVGHSQQIGWQRLPRNHSVFKSFADPSAGPTSGHYELLFSNGFTTFVGDIPDTGFYMSILSTVASPVSRGSVTLNSSDPFDFPVIDPGILSSQFDLTVLIESIRAGRRFLTASPWQDYVIQPFAPLYNLTSDEELEQFVRSHTGTEWHPSGTAAMSAKGSSFGVVDPDLRVKGVHGVRVVDASIFPFIPAAHIQAPVYIVAERASDLIKADYS